MPGQPITATPLSEKAAKQLRTEFRCDLNLPTAHLTIYSEQMSTIQDMVLRLQPKAVFKVASQTREAPNSLLVFDNPSAVEDASDAIGAISEMAVPRNWNISRNQLHRAA